MMFWMGIFPQTFLRKMDASIEHLLNQVKKQEIVLTEVQKAPVNGLTLGSVQSIASEDESQKEEDPR